MIFRMIFTDLDFWNLILHQSLQIYVNSPSRKQIPSFHCNNECICNFNRKHKFTSRRVRFHQMSTIVIQIIIRSMARDPLHQKNCNKICKTLYSSAVESIARIRFDFTSSIQQYWIRSVCSFAGDNLIFAFVWSPCLFALCPFFHRSPFHKDSQMMNSRCTQE